MEDKHLELNRLVICFKDISTLLDLRGIFLNKLDFGTKLLKIERLYSLKSEVDRLKRLKVPFAFTDYGGYIGDFIRGRKIDNWDSFIKNVDEFSKISFDKDDRLARVFNYNFEDELYGFVSQNLYLSEQKLLKTFVFEFNSAESVAQCYNILLEQNKDLMNGIEYMQVDQANSLFAEKTYSDMYNYRTIELEQGLTLLRERNIPLRDTIVSVIDTGVDDKHIDINNNMWADVNGHRGFNYVSNNNDTSDIDDAARSHGTHIAGTIAAVMGNNEGIFGVAANQSHIMVRKPFQQGYSQAYDSNCAKAIRDSYNQGARVINISWGRKLRTNERNLILDAAIEEVSMGIVGTVAHGQRTVVVCAAGNANEDVALYSPANNPRVIAVGATRQDGKKWESSNYGNKITVYAPGVAISSLKKNNTYGYNSGTSMAAPHVVGLVALMLSVKPQLQPKDVKELIRQYADVVVKNETGAIVGRGINVLNTLKNIV